MYWIYHRATGRCNQLLQFSVSNISAQIQSCYVFSIWHCYKDKAVMATCWMHYSAHYCFTLLSPNSIMLTFTKTSPWGKLWTQIMKVRNINHVADFHDLCPQQSPQTLSQTLTATFPVHCNGLNSIKATQTGLSRTCHKLCCKQLDMLK